MPSGGGKGTLREVIFRIRTARPSFSSLYMNLVPDEMYSPPRSSERSMRSPTVTRKSYSWATRGR